MVMGVGGIVALAFLVRALAYDFLLGLGFTRKVYAHTTEANGYGVKHHFKWFWFSDIHKSGNAKSLTCFGLFFAKYTSKILPCLAKKIHRYTSFQPEGISVKKYVVIGFEAATELEWDMGLHKTPMDLWGIFDSVNSIVDDVNVGNSKDVNFDNEDNESDNDVEEDG
ncbi:hypothetical protein Tco_1413768 [Tanacetum coccineum]